MGGGVGMLGGTVSVTISVTLKSCSLWPHQTVAASGLKSIFYESKWSSKALCIIENLPSNST